MIALITVDDIDPALPYGPGNYMVIFLIMDSAGFISSTVSFKRFTLFGLGYSAARSL